MSIVCLCFSFHLWSVIKLPIHQTYTFSCGVWKYKKGRNTFLIVCVLSSIFIETNYQNNKKTNASWPLTSVLYHSTPPHTMLCVRGSSSHCHPRSYCLCLWMITNKQSYSDWQVLTPADLTPKVTTLSSLLLKVQYTLKALNFWLWMPVESLMVMSQ